MGVNPTAIPLWRQLRVDVAGSASTSAGAGSPWGSDEIGSLFGVAYGEVSRLGSEALKTLTAGVRGTTRGLVAMARNAQQDDQDAVTEFGSVGAAL